MSPSATTTYVVLRSSRLSGHSRGQHNSSFDGIGLAVVLAMLLACLAGLFVLWHDTTRPQRALIRPRPIYGRVPSAREWYDAQFQPNP